MAQDRFYGEKPKVVEEILTLIDRAGEDTFQTWDLRTALLRCKTSALMTLRNRIHWSLDQSYLDGRK